MATAGKKKFPFTKSGKAESKKDSQKCGKKAKRSPKKR